jgi:hypothetical protein
MRRKPKKRNKKKECGSKVGHPTKIGAIIHIKKMKGRNFIFHEIHPYKCKFCGLWHVGRSKEIYYDIFDKLLK